MASQSASHASRISSQNVTRSTGSGKITGSVEDVSSPVSLSESALELESGSGSVTSTSLSSDSSTLLSLLKLDGTLVLVGAPGNPLPVSAFNLFFPRRQLAGSLIGGLAETQEMLDFCGRHDIVCDIEVIRMQQINEAYERMLRSDVKYRFVIDMASLKR